MAAPPIASRSGRITLETAELTGTDTLGAQSSTAPAVISGRTAGSHRSDAWKVVSMTRSQREPRTHASMKTYRSMNMGVCVVAGDHSYPTLRRLSLK